MVNMHNTIRNLLPFLVHGGLELVAILLTAANAGAVHSAVRLTSAGHPGLAGLDGGNLLIALHGRHGHRLHHGAGEAVEQKIDGIRILVGKIKGLIGHFCRFLQGRRRQHDHLEAAVAAGLRGLKIVLLGGLDGADSGAAALEVSDDGGQMLHGHPGNGLAHQRDAAAGRRGHGAVINIVNMNKS